ncbi:DHA2 family efflux MFS transporter permease subunit [Rhodococcoides kyotonense]|uniref:Drug resistance transporter, EmrB/QacA subfamily n=1 Tax=Rhodococcoides kyotonense TaxID=398843 RepID=A0A239K9Q1_9NOCA|nr:DHA2 family efflux MFS transporter permease subunit [Rhodococcus kyotonensis]SNT14488.1 drug resistance transporter, EmrB/QacA subfamily [Rhodococcus kyotonensis]
MNSTRSPWFALSALVIGFFMIVLDMTIVAVANPAIMVALDADVSQVIWATSAYLLAFAVPLLASGRLGDHLGPKNLYICGIAVFTGASLLCGLSGSIEALIAARALQGFGAALMAPQTMAVITRIFDRENRAAAMGVWGAVAGFANLAGPLLGGVLVDIAGWEWIFFVNVPVGVVALLLAVRLVPTLPTQPHRLDWRGVLLSGAGIFLLVFGLQEGHSRNWDTLTIVMVVGGIATLVVFVVDQARTKGEPLLPLVLFRDRNFALSNVAIAIIGASVAAVMVPLYFYLQAVRDMSPTRSALFAAPMAITTLILAPIVGKISGRFHPRTIPTTGFVLFALSVFWFSTLMTPDSSTTMILVVAAVTGAANACIWAPLAATATRNLPEHQAGAGSGVYNAIRQVGSVLGSAAIATVMADRMSANGLGSGKLAEGGLGLDAIPEFVKVPFSRALSESLYLPIGVLLVGIVMCALFVRDKSPSATRSEPSQASDVDSKA